MKVVDAVLAFGCGLCVTGAWLVYEPAAFILAGLILIVGAMLWQLGERKP